MKKILSLLLFCLPFIASAQYCSEGDTVINQHATTVTTTTATVTGTPGAAFGVQWKVTYVRTGYTDTANTVYSGSITKNLSGLLPGYQYKFYYTTNCGGLLSWNNHVYATFTTTSSTVSYTPQTAAGYQFKYVKIDSGLAIPYIDTSLGRATTRPGSIVCNPSDSNLYRWTGTRWSIIAIDSLGIVNALNHKVDSVTIASDSLFYWINGTAYGQVFSALGWSISGNAGTTAGTNFLGTTDAAGLMFKINNTRAGVLDLSDNVSFGVTSNVLGASNVGIGASTLSNNSGDNNTGIGFNSLYNNTTGEGNIGLGSNSGSYATTQSYRLYVNSFDRANIAGDTTKSIIYGYQDATASNQRLYLNSQVYMPYAASGVGTKALRINPGTGLITYADTTIASTGLTVGTTTIASGTTTKVLYDNAGVLGEYTVTGSGNVVMSADPALTSAATTGSGVTFTANSLTSGIGFDASTSSITSGNLMKLTSTSTAANAFGLLSIVSSGANANSTRTATGATISVTNTGTTSTNVGLNVTASGATNNYAALFTGNVGIGTTSPGYGLTLGSTKSEFSLFNTATETTNYERGYLRWNSNQFQLGTEVAGTGTARDWVFEVAGDKTLYFKTNSTQRMTVSSNGVNVLLNGAASKPATSLTGTWFTGGSGTTTKPQLLIEPTGTTSTAWSTSGTGLGINAASGFTGNLFDGQLAGVSKFKVTSTGLLTVVGNNGATDGAANFNSSNNDMSFNAGFYYRMRATGSNKVILGSGWNGSTTYTYSEGDFIAGSSSAGTSTLQSAGSFATAYVAKSADYTATGSDQTIVVTATGKTITLPTAVSIAGRIYTIKLTASGSGTVATTSSQTIDGSTTYSLSAQYKYVTVQSDGANWNIIANN